MSRRTPTAFSFAQILRYFLAALLGAAFSAPFIYAWAKETHPFSQETFSARALAARATAAETPSVETLNGELMAARPRPRHRRVLTRDIFSAAPCVPSAKYCRTESCL